MFRNPKLNEVLAAVKISADFRVASRQPQLRDAISTKRRDPPQFQSSGGDARVPREFAPRRCCSCRSTRPSQPRAKTASRVNYSV